MNIEDLEIDLFHLIEEIRSDRTKTKEKTKKFICKIENELEDSLKQNLFEQRLNVIPGRGYNLFHISIVENLHELSDWCMENNSPINALEESEGKVNSLSPFPALEESEKKVNPISPVALSCYCGNEYVLTRLIEVQADIFYIIDFKGYNLCQEIGMPEEEEIKEKNAPLNKTTMLHEVLSTNKSRLKNKEKIVEILADNYPDLLIKNWYGQTALDVAVDDICVNYINSNISKREANLILNNINKTENNLSQKKRI